MNEEIHFFEEDRNHPLEPYQSQLKEWLHNIATLFGFTPLEINYIFCSDEYLLDINKTYLDHDYYTDIITFDNSDTENELIADIYISVDRLEDHANQYNVSIQDEALRVIAHGLLHLVGFNDKTDADQDIMTQEEDKAIVLFISTYKNQKPS